MFFGKKKDDIEGTVPLAENAQVGEAVTPNPITMDERTLVLDTKELEEEMSRTGNGAAETMPPKRKTSMRQIMLMALFTALFVVVYFFRIPVLDKYVHFGNVFAMLAVLLLGPEDGITSVLLGVFLADILTGYMGFLLTLILYAIKVGITSFVFEKIKHKYSPRKAALYAIVPGFLAYIVASFLAKYLFLIIAGSQALGAAVAMFFTETASIINMVIGCILIPILYPIMAKILKVPLANEARKQ